MKLLAVVFSQNRSITDIWQGSKYGSAASFSKIFPLSLQTQIYKYFCFSSGSLQLICSCDVNQKYYTIFHWFPNHLLYIDHGNTKFSYIYTIEMRKSLLRKTSRWKKRLIYTINKNNNKNNNKNQARITKAFEKFLVSETILSIITKIFLLCTLNDIASFNFFKFCWFEQSINTLKFKVSASKSCCFCFLLLPNLWKIAQKFKILAILYFYCFIIIFNLALQQVLLVIELTKVEIFVSKYLVSSIPFAFENI